MTETMTETITETTTLAGIDAGGLEALAAAAVQDPSVGHKILRTRTVCDGGFRNLTHVRSLDPVVVDEPCALLGEDKAPNPSEIALAALGSCISVGLLANATARGVTLDRIEIELEGDIDISAVWGVGDTPETKIPGFTAVRAHVTLAGDTDADTLAEIERNAMVWSPVVNTFSRPVAFSSSLTVA
jgi:uncharacterized OsmC-like protein